MIPRATILVALSIECPQGGNPESCQLHEFRKKPFSEKKEWIGTLTDDEVMDLFENHLECIDTKGYLDSALKGQARQ